MDRITDRTLHKGVGRQNPERRHHRAERDQPDADHVDLFGQTLPPENPQANKRRFEEKRKQRFDRQRRPEHVTHKAGVSRPVHAELELLQNPRHHADSEVDQEQLPPKFSHSFVLFFAFDDIHRFHDRDREHQSNGQRYEKKVKNRRRGKLDT